MLTTVFPTNPALLDRSRLRTAIPAALRSDSVQVLVLISMGVVAAALTTYVHMRMRIPGHKIVLNVLPMGCGLAFAPRRNAGLLLALSSTIAWIGFNFEDARWIIDEPSEAIIELGAIASLGSLGILLDLAGRVARSGKSFYGAFAAAGFTSNYITFAAKLVQRNLDDGITRIRYSEWIGRAPLSFAVCGLLAGLVAAGIFFQFSEGKHRPHDGNTLSAA